MVDAATDAMTLRRLRIGPTCGDAFQGSGFFLQDSYVNIKDGQNHTSSDPHADGVQSIGGCGPQFYIHNTFIAEGAVEYGGSCGAVPAGYCSNATYFIQGRWKSGTYCDARKVPSLVIANNYLSGGIATNRWSNNNGPIVNTRMVDNVWEKDSWRVEACSHATGGYTPVTNPTPETNEICFEYDNATNTDEFGDPIDDTDPGCQTAEMTARDSCPDVEPIPVTVISNFQLGVTQCDQSNPACNNITLSANVSTNEGPRAQWNAESPDVSSLLHAASPGGSFRWRYSCGGSSGNTSATPCTTQATRCTGYEDNGADLWYHYPDCDGLSSCTMTGVCDYQSETAGTYTAKIYAEAGPGAAYRPSDHDEATFAVR
jgi:hypothetical protein